MIYYKDQTVATLRKLCKERAVGSGVWRAGASKNDLVRSLLKAEKGETTPPPLPEPHAAVSTAQAAVSTAPTAPAASTAPGSDLGAIIAQAIEPHVKAQLDVAQVIELIGEHGSPGMDVDTLHALCIGIIKDHTAPIEVHVKQAEKPVIKLDRQHYMFPMLLLLTECRIPSFLAGPAGSGKTTAAHSLSKALSLPYEGISFGPMTTQAQMFGYKDANGIYHDTALVRAALSGGVFLGDECDAANAGVLTGINMVLANGQVALPEGMADKSANFVPVFAGNTFGTGANRVYVGRNQLDAATLDRFAFLEWGYDEGLEASICGITEPSPVFDMKRGGAATEQEWLYRVRAIRHASEKLQQRQVISPRASIYGKTLIRHTADHPTCPPIGAAVLEDMLIWKGTDKATRDKITAAIKGA